jgi:4-hydroxybenzoate adenylyltransferase
MTDTLTGENLAAHLAETCNRNGWRDRTAMVVGENNLTHGEIHDGAARTAGVLAGLGVRPGDLVAIALADGAELAWTFLAAVRLGAIAAPLNPSLAEREHRTLCDVCAPRLVVCSAELVERFAPARTVELDELLALSDGHEPVPARAVGAGAAAYAQFTSGTTGRAKAAVHRHGDPLVFQQAFGAPVLRLHPGSTTMSVSKMFFAYGLGNSLFYPLLAGSRAVLCAERPTPSRIAAMLGETPVDVLFAVPSFYGRMLAHEHRDALRGIPLVVSAGEPLPARMEKELAEVSGGMVANGLGSTEVGQTFASNSWSAHRPGTVGMVLAPYRVRVMDDEENELPTGSLGRLEVQGPTTPMRYLADGSTSWEIHHDEWLRTGDRAILDRDGFLHHRGRIDDIELVGGINVDPAELEATLCEHPAVVEAAVCAIPDEDGASVLRAFIVCSQPPSRRATVEQELLALVGTVHAAFKVPRSFVFLGELPRTASGKLMRRILRSEHANLEG